MQLKSLLSLSSLLLSSTVYATTYTIPNAPYDGQQTIEFAAKADEFDGQKITPYPDSNSYEWWYFDAVSSTTLQSVTIVFFETLTSSFPTGSDSYLSLQFAGTHADGSLFVYAVPAEDFSVATITTTGDSASGVWEDTGFSFSSDPTATIYTVEIDNAEFGISGTFTITSNGAPAHAPCGLRAPGANEIILPTVGWANIIPDSNAIVNMTVAGQALQFEGYGYHDKNWGNIPFTQATQSWYWGHGRLGPYSIVWFDALDQNHTEYVSGYVTKGPEVLEASCAPGAVVARPYGDNSAYPPQPNTDPPTGFNVAFDLGALGTFDVQAVVAALQVPSPTYGRYIGPLTGTLGGVEYTGTALFEEFKFPQL